METAQPPAGIQGCGVEGYVSFRGILGLYWGYIKLTLGFDRALGCRAFWVLGLDWV